MLSHFITPFRALRAAMLLVVVACATPDRAAAGCGDYVTILNDPQAAAAHQAMPANGESTGPVKPPCHGLNCSESPFQHHAPLAPVNTVGPQVKELAETLLAGGGANQPRATIDRDTSFPRPVRRASSVFHPPRLV